MTVRTRRRPRTARALAAAGGTAAVVLLAGACGADATDDTEPEHRTFALAGKTLTVESSDSTLELVPAGSDAEGVRVTRWFDGETVLGGDPKVTWTMEGDRLKLDMECSGVIANCSARHRVEVPRGVAVTVENKDGRVTASGFQDPLKVRSKDGPVTVENIGAPLDLRSSDGSVTARRITSRQVAVDSKDGSVRLELAAVPDRVEARSKDGSVDIAVPDRKGGKGGKEVAYDVRTDVSDGSVDVAVPRDRNSAHHVSVRSADGKVTVRSAN
ncbi:DUF4097 family beta strand repeat-containing protein [Streptomyces sp. NPDC050732]|uniref:DUF4097 family beta strand repeat-containing protein n=1 Tax=Streptomyces sp. NPDC050732 TaxID=3154632 RepID=UPI0034248C88